MNEIVRLEGMIFILTSLVADGRPVSFLYTVFELAWN